MSLVKWNPIDALDIFGDFDSLADHFFGRAHRLSPHTDGPWAPRVDIVESDDAYELHAEIPGVDKKDLEISVKDDILTISGEKKREEKTDEKNYFRYERSFGRFERSFRLTDAVKPDSITAQFKNGVLTVTVPKVEEPKKVTRKIAIK